MFTFCAIPVVCLFSRPVRDFHFPHAYSEFPFILLRAETTLSSETRFGAVSVYRRKFTFSRKWGFPRTAYPALPSICRPALPRIFHPALPKKTSKVAQDVPFYQKVRSFRKIGADPTIGNVANSIFCQLPKRKLDGRKSHFRRYQAKMGFRFIKNNNSAALMRGAS